jgi:hypothetical protein
MSPAIPFPPQLTYNCNFTLYYYSQPSLTFDKTIARHSSSLVYFLSL